MDSNKKNILEQEHILVCISSSLSNKKVIEQAAKLADAFSSKLTAIYVEGSKFSGELGEEQQQLLRDNIHLAKKFGAKVMITYGEDIVEQIIEYTRLTKVTKVVLGRGSEKEKFLEKLFQYNVSKRLNKLAPELEVFQIAEDEKAEFQRHRIWKYIPVRKEDVLWDAFWLLFIQGITTLSAYLFQAFRLPDGNMMMVYVLAVFIHSLKARYLITSFVFSIVSVLVVNFCFTAPKWSLAIQNKNYIVTLFILLFTSLISSGMTQKIKVYARQAVQKSYRTEILLETNRALQAATNRIEIGQKIVEQLQKLLDREVKLYWNGEEVVKRNSNKNLYYTIQNGEQIFAEIEIAHKEAKIPEFEKGILIAILNESAVVLEKDELLRQQKDTEIKLKQEQLRANILRTISHDLRTPLTCISGNASILVSNGEKLQKEQKIQLYKDIYNDSNWLIELVENLLSVTRMENGTMQIHMQDEIVVDVVDEALKHLNPDAKEHRIVVEEEEMLLVKMDARLMTQVISNLVNNAIKYTQTGSHITIRLWKKDKNAMIDVIDDGDGIQEQEKTKLFRLFYTVDGKVTDGRRGLGLGLALCKSIVNAHHGTIEILDNHPHGAIFRITLKAEEVHLG